MITSWKNWGSKLAPLSCLIFGGALAFSTNCASAQITPDGTLPNNSRVTTQDNIRTIERGTQAGSNLFHSFEEFSVPTGTQAYFNNTLDIQNIISRVTGKSVSNIDGLIGAKGNANLFLINSNGIIFGANARLAIGGSFLASTARSLNFADGTNFSTTASQTTPLLTISVPIGLQYAGRERNILNQSQTTDSGKTIGLQVQPGKTLALVGGDVSLDGGHLQAPGGRIELGGLADAGTVGLQVDGNNLSLSFPSGIDRANVLLTNKAGINVSAGGGGDIAINVRKLEVLGLSTVNAGIGVGLGSVGSQAGDITLNATDVIAIGELSSIENVVDLDATGNGGNINIQAGSLFMTNNAELGSRTVAQGNAGNVSMQVEGAVELVNSTILSATGYIARGNSGNISIKAGSLSMMNNSSLSTSATPRPQIGVPSGQGNGGNISLQVEGALKLVGSSINSVLGSRTVGNGGDIYIQASSLSMTNEEGKMSIISTAADGQGNAGKIFVQVDDEVSLTTSFIGSFVNFYGEDYRAVGKGGDIQIKAGSLTMNADPNLRTPTGGSISATTLGTGNAGNISVQVKDTVSFSGYSFIRSGVGYNALGNGGNINIKARSLSMTDGTRLTSTTEGKGNAGDIFVQVENEVSLKNNSIDSNVSIPKAVGDGGNIQIKARSILMTDGAKLNTSTQGQGDAGNIEINADDSVSISGSNPKVKLLSSGLFTSTEERAIGQGGDISVTTGILRLSDGAVLNARTRNDASGGNITVKTNALDLIGGGQILTSTFSSGSAGNITVNASDRVNISGSDRTYAARLEEFGEARVDPDGSNSGIFATVRGNATANAGKIEVNARSIGLDKQGTITTETTLGEGGDITLNVKDILLLRNNSSITATAGTAQQGGNGGNININTPNGFIVAGSRENSDITANAYIGKGGNVLINAFGIYGIQYREKENPQTNDITASSRFGFNGTVQINTPDIDFNRGLINLPVVPVDTEVAQGCSAGGSQAQSKFMITGRGGLPPNPGETLSTDTVEVDLVTLKREAQRSTTAVSTSTISPAPIPIVEATRWVKNIRGEIVLTATPTSTQHSPWQKKVECGSP